MALTIAVQNPAGHECGYARIIRVEYSVFSNTTYVQLAIYKDQEHKEAGFDADSHVTVVLSGEQNPLGTDFLNSIYPCVISEKWPEAQDCGDGC